MRIKDQSAEFENQGVISALPATTMPILRWPEMRFANTPSSRHAANIQNAAEIRATKMLGGTNRNTIANK